MRKLWGDEAWQEYLNWQTQDKKTLKRINQLIKDACRSPFEGVGKVVFPAFGAGALMKNTGLSMWWKKICF